MATLVNSAKLSQPKHSPLHREWSAYYQAVKGRPPRETLLFALDRFDRTPGTNGSRFAVDLGCGDGRDTVEILRRGWQVLAIDGAGEAIDRLILRPDIDLVTLTTQVQKFESLTLPGNVDLINASFCMPFCPEDQFSTFWATITDALRPGGRLSGQLFGIRDSWTQYSNICFHSYDQVKALLTGFELERLDEEEHPGTTPLGEERYWHIFHIVARKP